MRHRIVKAVARGRQWARRMPLRWRLALASFMLLAVLLAALGTVVSFAAQRALLMNEANALQNQARVASNSLHGGTLSVQNQLLVERVAGPTTAAAVISADGTVQVSSDNVPLQFTPPPVVPVHPGDVQRALNESLAQPYYLLATDSAGNREIVVLVPISVVRGGPPVEVLALNTPTRHVDRAVELIRVILGVGIAAAILIAALLALPLVSAALRPLDAMERASRRIATGELHLRLDVPPTEDEIGRLARSFNTMVARLDEAFQHQKQFVSDASHELRTPLTALGGGMEMLLLGADQGDAEAARRLLRGMYGEVERMRRLVEDLLTLTRLDEGRANLYIADVDAGAAVRDVCEQAQRLSSGQEIVCEVGPGLPLVRADSDRLRQILLNLVDNALKYTPPPGRVTVSATSDSNRATVALSVSDQGSGIAPEALPHVFDRFYRADIARVRSGSRTSGSGLGLSIVKGLVEAQRGSVGITSELGMGTTITIHLPAWRTSTTLPALPPPSVGNIAREMVPGDV